MIERSQPPYKKGQSVYWIANEYIGLSESEAEPLEEKFIGLGLKYCPPGLGGDGSAIVREIMVVVLSVHQHWQDIFLAILAARIDRLITVSSMWFKKQKKIKRNKNLRYVAIITVYKQGILRKQRIITVKADLDQPPTRKEVRRILGRKE